MTHNPQVKFTYGHYLQLPEGDRRELIDGDFLCGSFTEHVAPEGLK